MTLAVGAKDTFAMERAGVAAMALGIIDRCLDVCVDYANDRAQFGHPIGEFQLIQELARMEVARLNVQNLVFRCIEATTANQPLDLAETSAMKLYSARAATEAALDAVQIFGGSGYMAELPVEQLARDAKALQIYAGTDELQITHIARGLLRQAAPEIAPGRHTLRGDVGNGTQNNAGASRGRTTRQDDPVTRFGEFDGAARAVRDLASGHAAAVDQLPGQRGLLRDHLQHRGGYSFFRDARLRRLTRYRYNNVPTDVGGRYLYVRDAASGDFWSPSWQPTRADVEQYQCRHGLGYTVIASRRAGIGVETLYFVPLGETLEIWRSRVTNRRDTAVQLAMFSAIEFCLWDAGRCHELPAEPVDRRGRGGRWRDLPHH